MTSQIVLARTGSLAQLLAHQFDICPIAGQEQPSRFDVELVRVRSQFLGCVSLRVDADGVEEYVTTHSLAEETLHLSQFGGLERT